MCCQFENCCFILSVKNGSTIIAIFGLSGSALELLIRVFNQSNETNLFYWIVNAILFLAVIVNGCLLCGLHSDRPGLMFPWIFWIFTIMAYFILSPLIFLWLAIFYATLPIFYMDLTIKFILLLIGNIVGLYLWNVVYSVYWKMTVDAEKKRDKNQLHFNHVA